MLAVPFFILAGNLMNSAGITNRIYGFAVAAVGWLKGGLGHVNVVGSVIFAGMSGTAVADAGGLGTIEIKAMRDHGYKTDFAVGITAASSTIGPIIPPSLPMVIFGVMANTSIGQLFAAGLVPGLLMAAFLMLYVTWYAHRHGIGRDQVFRLKVLGVTFVSALPALLTPAIIIGGMAFGWFTPTEAAIAACAWALLLGVLLYRSLSWKQFYRITLDTIETTAAVLIIVGAASLFGWVLTTLKVTDQITSALLSISDNPLVILLMINVILLIIGCFMETIAAISILVPVLMPVVLKVGIDPVQFGVVMVLNLMIGLLTPPVGMVLFILARVAGIPFDRTVKAVTPFLVPLLLVLALISIFPELTLAIPKYLYR
jgi:tripartite ATP-independent transporter DctM subunit